MIALWLLALSLGMTWVPDGPDARQAAAPVPVVMLASDRPAYELGATATFTIAVDNPSDAPITLTFPSAQRFDVVVLAEDGQTEVWRWSGDRFFAAAVTERSFPPGLTLLGRESWDWRDQSGAPIQPGTYQVVGSLATSPPRAGNVVELQLTAP